MGLRLCSAEAGEKAPYMKSSQLLMIITVFVYIKKVSHLPSQLGIFVFTFTVKRFHIYGALLHLALKIFTFTGPYYIFTFRGATYLSFFANMYKLHIFLYFVTFPCGILGQVCVLIVSCPDHCHLPYLLYVI